MNFTKVYLAVKALTGNRPDSFPMYGLLVGTVGKLKFITQQEGFSL